MLSIPLGAMEKWLLLEQAVDTGHYTNWSVVLDRPLDRRLVAAALERLRPLAPLFFSRLVVDDDRVRIRALYDDQLPIEEFITVHEHVDGGTHGLLSHMLNEPLDPRRDGFFRCHVVCGPTPMLAVQSSHVAGDGYTNGWLRAALFEEYGRCESGEEAGKPDMPDLSCYQLGLRDIQAVIPTVPIKREEGRAPLRRLHEARMSEPRPDDAACEIRTFRARIERDAFRAIFQRAAGLQVSTLCFTGACLAIAVDRCCDTWSECESDFIAPSFPRDLRTEPRWANRLGNIVFPFGVPLQKEDLTTLDRAATRIQEMFEIAKDNWIYYRVFSHRVRAASKAEVPPDLVNRPRLGSCAGQSTLHPLPVFGVTELPHRPMSPTVGSARVLDSHFQSPIIGRRFVDGTALLSGSVRWHPTFDDRIQGLLQTFLNCLHRGDPDNAAALEWELIGV